MRTDNRGEFNVRKCRTSTSPALRGSMPPNVGPLLHPPASGRVKVSDSLSFRFRIALPRP